MPRQPVRSGREDRAAGRPGSRLTPAGLLDVWVAVDGTDVLGHVALTGTGHAMAAEAGLPPDGLASGRLFATASARRRAVARALLATATTTAAASGLRLVLEVEDG